MEAGDGKKKKAYNVVVGIILGQVASLLVTATGLTSSTLARKGIDAPTSQSFCNYILVAAVYGVIFLLYKKKMEVSWYFYLILAFIDVEANYIVVKAYQYTSLTSVMLLDCWTIPCVLFLTWFFLKTKYRIKQFIGVGFCVAGLVIVILSDVHAKDRSGGKSPVKGDIFVIVGSMLYAISNVSEEFLMKKVGFVELMACFGCFGALISACQLSILERHELQTIKWTASSVLPFLGYAVTLFSFYTLVPFILKVSGSTMLNLSLLTSDMWAVLIRIFAYHQTVDWMYFIAFATVAFGLVIYSSSRQYTETITSQTLEKSASEHGSQNHIQREGEEEMQEVSPTVCSIERDTAFASEASVSVNKIETISRTKDDQL